MSRRFAGRHGWAGAGFVALTILLYWPVAARPFSMMAADFNDGAYFAWNLWWVPRQLAGGDSPLFTQDLFHPAGASMAFTTSITAIGILSAPIQWIFGLPFALNVVQLGAVALTGLGTYLLAHDTGAARWPAFFAGAAVAFTPYRTGRIFGHHNLNHSWLLPFGLLVLLRLYERPTTGRAVVFGLLAAGTVYTDLTYALFLGLAAGLVAVWRWRETRTRRVGRRLVQAGLVAAVLSAPLVAAMVGDVVNDRVDPIPGWGGADFYSADALSWVVPPNSRRFLPDVLAGTSARVTIGERVVFPGWTLLAAASVGALRGGRGRGLWVSITGAFWILSLGPFLQVNGWSGDRFETLGTSFSVPLPYLLLRRLPLLEGARVPARFGIMAVIALAVLAAVGLTRLTAGRPRFRAGLAVVAGAVVLAETLPVSPPPIPAAIPPAYRAIAQDPDPGAVLEIPLQWQTGFGNYGDADGGHRIFLYYATAHGRPLVAGFAARYPAQTLDRVMRTPVYDQILGMSPRLPEGAGGPPVPAGRPPGATYPLATFTAGDLRELGIAFVVTHRDRPRPGVESYIDGLGLDVIADDGTVVIRKVPPGLTRRR